MSTKTTGQIQIQGTLPGPVAAAVTERERRVLAEGTKCWETPAVPEKAWGVHFQDVDGNVMMDWTNGMVTILGHSHPGWIDAMKKQLEQVVYFNSPDFPNPQQASLAEALARIAPGEHDKRVFLSCSGTEAVEAALKLARIGTRRNLVVGWLGDFHGRTAGSLALTASKSIQRKHNSAVLNNTHSLPFAYCYRCWYGMTYPSCNLHCATVLDRYFKTLIPPDDVAAIIYEPVQGEGGYVIPPPEWFEVIGDIARKHGILLIADEVQTCFGKSGKWFTSEHFQVIPDIIAMAKGLANGMALGATVFPDKLNFEQQGMHSNTFGGQTLSCASANYTIQTIIEQKLLERVRQLGACYRDKLLGLQEKHACIGDVRTLGLLMGVEFVKDRKTREAAKVLRDYIVEECYRRGLLILSCGESVIRLTPAFVITEAEIDEGMAILDQAITIATKQVGV